MNKKAKVFKSQRWDLGMVGGQSSDVRPPLDTQKEINKPAPSIDVPKLEERAFRRGLIAALECILRELR
jgi:hypothetical protein